ncbi:hypothetical protein KSC_071410 [Ktedonobacter sp. SOSP1-52]|nr:hypothetical protein KSC_071410 [Ktedonobacter sp. SOSP1-52]
MGEERKTHGWSCGRPGSDTAQLAVEINGAQFEQLALVQVLQPYLVLPSDCVRVFASSSW